jgi:hypothetical protein
MKRALFYIVRAYFLGAAFMLIYLVWSSINRFPAISSGQLEVDFTSDQVGDRDEIA